MSFLRCTRVISQLLIEAMIVIKLHLDDLNRGNEALYCRLFNKKPHNEPF